MEETRCILRFASPDDAKTLVSIYSYYVLNTTVTFETEVPSVQEFAERIRGFSEFYPYLVCEIDGVPAGYAYAHRFGARAAYRFGAELSVYVDMEHQRQGIGRALYCALCELAKEQGVLNVYGIISLPNPKSVAMHESMGFEPMGSVKDAGYKLGRWLDTGYFGKPLCPLPQQPAEPVSIWSVDAEVRREILQRCAEKCRI